MPSWSTPYTLGIRREILAVLAAFPLMTVSAATARVAAGHRARRQRRGESPSSVRTAGVLVYQVGQELAGEVAAPQEAHGAAPASESRSSRRAGRPS